MGKPYSIDLRERVAASVLEGGLSRNMAAAQFGVAVSTVVTWVKRYQETGSIEPGQMGGHKPKAIRDEHEAFLTQRVREGAFTLRGLARGWVRELADRGLKVDDRSVWNFVQAEKLSFKKTVAASERDRPDVARRRARRAERQDQIDPERLVFIDETWVKTNMEPLRGWAPLGKRLVAKVPHGHWKTSTFIAALRCDRIEAPWILDGPITAEAFKISVEKVLTPTLRPGDLVIMDNLGSHKGKAVRQAIRAAGAKLS
jgi:transposase